MFTRAALAVASFTAVAATGCAHDTGYGAMTTTWDQTPGSSTTTTPATTAAATPAAAGKPKVTAKEAAATFRAVSECLEKARDFYKKDPHAAEALVAECAQRDDFVDLEGFLKGPWTKDLKASESFELLVAQVIAHRGGFVEADTKVCRAAGVQLYDVVTALQQGNKIIGKIVLVRGAITNMAHEKWGKGKSLVGTIAESTWADDAGDETGGNIPARDTVETTGRLAFARLEKKEPRFQPDHALVVALRYEGPREYKEKGGENEGDDVKSLIGTAVGLYDTGGKLRQ